MASEQGKLIKPKDDENYIECKGLVRHPKTGHMVEMSFWIDKRHPSAQYFRDNVNHMSISGLEDV